MQYYRVKNWQRFQHYKDRNPPWIKLHYEMLSSQDWVMLADASKLLAVVCMLIASRNQGMVPADPLYFRRVAYLDKTPDFKPLLSCGFLENVLADDSECKQMQANARPETETETENPLPLLLPLPLPVGLDQATWDDFKATRKRLKSPLTDKGELLLLAELSKLTKLGHDPKLVVEKSIMNGWKGLFPLKEDTPTKAANQPVPRRNVTVL